MSADFPFLANLLFYATVAYLFGLTLWGLFAGRKRLSGPLGAGDRSLEAGRGSSSSRSTLLWVGLGLLVWILVLSVLSLRGFFLDFMALPPRPVLAVLGCVVTIVLLARSKRFGQFLFRIPPAWLILPQAFRIVVEINLWLLHENGNTPVQMTFEGWNFDILAGLSAPLVAWLAFGRGRKNYRLALVWNVLSLALLLNILTIAVLSFPLLDLFEEPNTFIGYFPYILLPGFVAPYALMLHVLSIRQLRMLQRQEPGAA